MNVKVSKRTRTNDNDSCIPLKKHGVLSSAMVPAENILNNLDLPSKLFSTGTSKPRTQRRITDAFKPRERMMTKLHVSYLFQYSVTSIPDGGFLSCTSLTSVIIPGNNTRDINTCQ
jgi:hypothetical protein